MPLPRFELDHESGHESGHESAREHERHSSNLRDRDRDCEETWDPADAAATVERSPISDALAKKLLRPVGSSARYSKRGSFPILSSPASVSEQVLEGEEEVAPEDILLEAYPEPQAPPPASAVLKRAEPPPPLDVASLGPARIDALLRSELPPRSAPPPPPLFSQSVSSIAPVALSQRPPLPQAQERELAVEITRPASPPWTAPPPRQATGWGRVTMVALFAAGLAAGLTFTVAAPAGSFARARTFAASLVTKVKPQAAAPSRAQQAPSAAPSGPATTTAPAGSASAGVVSAPSTVSVDALPKVEIEPGKTLVTFPPSAEGHRIFVDSQVLATGNAPAKLKCGTHNIRIGSGGKVRKVDLPCGQTYELR